MLPFHDIEALLSDSFRTETEEDMAKTASDVSVADELTQRLDEAMEKDASLEKRAESLRLAKLLVALDVLAE